VRNDDKYFSVLKKKNKSDLLSALESNIERTQESLAIIKKEIEAPTTGHLLVDSEDDYEYSRTKIKSLIERAETAIERMLELAQDSDHPRAFEVLSGMLKTSAEITDQLMRLQEQRRKLVTQNDTTPAGRNGAVNNTTTNNVVFTGSTTELQKFLASQKVIV
jgi:hypothetical protein